MDTNFLIELYSKASKHSNYQRLATDLRAYINEDQLDIKSRYEEERLAYFLKNIDTRGKTIMDIGANTGFFSFEMVKRGAGRVTACEGNKEHADFVRYAAAFLNLDKRVVVKNEYVNFNTNERGETFDILLLLNVLHHIGDDYGDRAMSLEKAKQTIIHSVNVLSARTRMMIFQLGFNWKGDRQRPLFPNGSKREMIDFIRAGTEKNWTIEKIGIAERRETGIVYNGFKHGKHQSG